MEQVAKHVSGSSGAGTYWCHRDKEELPRNLIPGTLPRKQPESSSGSPQDPSDPWHVSTSGHAHRYLHQHQQSQTHMHMCRHIHILSANVLRLCNMQFRHGGKVPEKARASFLFDMSILDL